MSALTTLQSIAAPTGKIGSTFYFHPSTKQAGEELGLDAFRFYVLGRGGVLGDTTPTLVRSAFGFFNQSLVEHLWRSASEVMPASEAAVAYTACNHALGRTLFANADFEVLSAYALAARTVIEAVDDSGLALFAGMRALDVPDDAPAAAMHEAMVLRELRGSVHINAIQASLLDPTLAHAIARPDMVKFFGHDQTPAHTDSDVAKLEAAEVLTDKMLEVWFAAASDTELTAIEAGTQTMFESLPAS